MQACSRVGCAMCSSSSTDHLTTWLIPSGGSQKRTLTLRVFHIPCLLLESFGNSTTGQAISWQEKSSASLGGAPSGGGIRLCHGGTSKGAQRLSPCNLPVTTNHFRCQTGFVSLGRDVPASLARTKTKSGFKMSLLAVGVGKVTPQSPGHVQVCLTPVLGPPIGPFLEQGQADAMA